MGSVEDVRNAGKAIAGFSHPIAVKERRVKAFSTTTSIITPSKSPPPSGPRGDRAAVRRLQPGRQTLPGHWREVCPTASPSAAAPSATSSRDDRHATPPSNAPAFMAARRGPEQCLSRCGSRWWGRVGWSAGRSSSYAWGARTCDFQRSRARNSLCRRGARMEVFVAIRRMGEVIEALRPNSVISALGTTGRMRVRTKRRSARRPGAGAGGGACGQGARSGALRFGQLGGRGPARQELLPQGQGRDRPRARQDRACRLDVLRPGLLRGKRGGERRIGERLAILASPSSTPARRQVARFSSDRRRHGGARGTLSGDAAGARAVCPRHDAIHRAARSLPQPVGE